MRTNATSRTPPTSSATIELIKMFDLGPIVQMHHFLGCISLFLVAVSDLVIDSLWEIHLLDPANQRSLRRGSTPIVWFSVAYTQAQSFTGAVVDRYVCISASRKSGQFDVEVG